MQRLLLSTGTRTRSTPVRSASPGAFQVYLRHFSVGRKSSRPAMPVNEDAGPIERRMYEKLTAGLSPMALTITNDSHLHAGHAAMRKIGGGSGETHFTVEVVSKEFSGKRAIQRHRLVNATLQAEFDAGLHALQIKAQTPEEAGMAGEGEKMESGAPPASGDAAAPGGP